MRDYRTRGVLHRDGSVQRVDYHFAGDILDTDAPVHRLEIERGLPRNFDLHIQVVEWTAAHANDIIFLACLDTSGRLIDAVHSRRRLFLSTFVACGVSARRILDDGLVAV